MAVRHAVWAALLLLLSMAACAGAADPVDCLAAAVVRDTASAEALSGCLAVGTVEITGDVEPAALRMLAFTSAQALTVHDTTQLADLAGLSVALVQADLVLRDNAQLRTLAGLEPLVAVGGALVVERNPRLTTISALAKNLTSAGSARVVDNDRLCEDLTTYKTFNWSAVVTAPDSLELETADICVLPLTVMVATLGAATGLIVLFCLFVDYRARRQLAADKSDGATVPLLGAEGKR